MCGVAAIFRRGDRPIPPDWPGLLAYSLRHRGPQDEGHLIVGEGGELTAARGAGTATGPASAPDVTRSLASHTSARAVLIHRRLAIFDLSEAGWQPMVDAPGELAVTFNGELFNFVDLPDDLKTRGYRFRSSSDTEVLLAAYREYREEFLLRCNGMWAFVLWDSRDRSMFAARDRFGVKPLYFWETPDYVAFCSEIIPLAALIRSRVRLNEQAVMEFLTLGIADP